MSRRALSPVPSAIGLIGLALIGFETVQSMRSVAINAFGTVLVFVGLALFVLAAVLTVVELTSSDDSAS